MSEEAAPYKAQSEGARILPDAPDYKRTYTTGERANSEEHLQLLSETIATHARKIAHEEWDTEHWPILAQILGNAKLNGKATLTLEGREFPIELVKHAIRDRFLDERAKALTAGLAEQVIATAFKTIVEKEGE